MEAILKQCTSYLFLVIVLLVSVSTAHQQQIEPSIVHRQGRQRTEILLRTVTVAVTSVAFESKPTLCVSLINATKACAGKRTLWPRDGHVQHNAISPSTVNKMEMSRAPTARLNDRDYEIGPNGELISSSQEIFQETGRTTERAPSFWRRWNYGFSNALGLARTIVRSVTETKTLTTTYVESVGYNHFYISGCIPPILHFPICDKEPSANNPILTGE